jgi:hypothetical protein
MAALVQESTGKAKECVHVTEGVSGVTMSDGRKYFFDHVYSPRQEQAHVYNTSVLPILKSFVDGFNATVFAYGQTGSGKTFTMGTDAKDLSSSAFEGIGILPRIVTDLYAAIERGTDSVTGYKVRCQFLEIYQDELRDLLAAKQVTCALREVNGQVVVTGAQEHKADDYQTIMKMFFHGCSMRTSGACLFSLFFFFLFLAVHNSANLAFKMVTVSTQHGL